MGSHRRVRSKIGAVLAAVIAISAVATPVFAARNFTWWPNMDVYQCVGRDGDHPPLQAGVEITGTEFWLTKTRGQAQQWINSSKLTVAINGVPVANPESYLQPPQEWGGGGWLALWAYPTGVTLTPGQTMTMYFRRELTSTVYDGYATYPAGLFYETTCVGKARGG